MTLPSLQSAAIFVQVPLHHHFYEHFPKYDFLFVSFFIVFFFYF